MVKQEEIQPGKKVSVLPDISDEMRKQGARFLIHGVGASRQGFEETAYIALNMLQKGLLSTEQRFDSGKIIKGANSDNNHMHGSADSVFTRIVSQEHIEYNKPISDFISLGPSNLLPA